MYREADGADDVRRAVREQFRRGADFIKVMTTGARTVELEDPNPAQMTREEIATIVDEAHRMPSACPVVGAAKPRGVPAAEGVLIPG